VTGSGIAAPRHSAAPPTVTPGRYRHMILMRPLFGQDYPCRRLVDLTDSRPPPSDDIGRKGKRQ
jgi:hypothetical protein